MKVVIIGKRSFLSKELFRNIPNSHLISSKFIKKEDCIKKYITNNTIYIINSFYPLFKILNNNVDNKTMVNQSIIYLINLLNFLSKKKNIKIIYSSTCAVSKFKTDNFNSRSVYTSIKIVCEQIIKEFCKKRNIKLIIMRLFNLYGGDDKASIIYKILNASKKKPIRINNAGNSKRDFIHVKDVSKIYNNIINSDFSGILEVGTGKSISLKSLINLNSGKFILSKKKIKENRNSKADIKILSKYINTNNFKNVKKYIEEKI
tara:strand:- start:956 stop:1738 length:783 start_codon:yes stop_codon:yes gene_type:complete